MAGEGGIEVLPQDGKFPLAPDEQRRTAWMGNMRHGPTPAHFTWPHDECGASIASAHE